MIEDETPAGCDVGHDWGTIVSAISWSVRYGTNYSIVTCTGFVGSGGFGGRILCFDETEGETALP